MLSTTRWLTEPVSPLDPPVPLVVQLLPHEQMSDSAHAASDQRNPFAAGDSGARLTAAIAAAGRARLLHGGVVRSRDDIRSCDVVLEPDVDPLEPLGLLGLGG